MKVNLSGIALHGYGLLFVWCTFGQVGVSVYSFVMILLILIGFV